MAWTKKKRATRKRTWSKKKAMPKRTASKKRRTHSSGTGFAIHGIARRGFTSDAWASLSREARMTRVKENLTAHRKIIIAQEAALFGTSTSAGQQRLNALIAAQGQIDLVLNANPAEQESAGYLMLYQLADANPASLAKAAALAADA